MQEKELSSDAFQWTYDRYIKGDPERESSFREELLKAEIAQQVYNLRNQAGLSTKQLSDLVGVEESVIEDIEEADYEGDFIAMASRIANALHRKVEVRFVPAEGKDAVEEPDIPSLPEGFRPGEGLPIRDLIKLFADQGRLAELEQEIRLVKSSD